MIEALEITIDLSEFVSVKSYGLFKHIKDASSTDIETIEGTIEYKVKTGRKLSHLSDPMILRKGKIDIYLERDRQVISDIFIRGTGTVFIRIMKYDRTEDN